MNEKQFSTRINFKGFIFIVCLVIFIILISSYYRIININPGRMYHIESFKNYFNLNENEKKNFLANKSTYLNKSNVMQSNLTEKCNPISNIVRYAININGEIYPKSLSLHRNKSINFECLNKNLENKLILLWTPFFGDSSFGFGIGKVTPFKKNNCPVYNCEITNDKSRLSESDLVITHMRDSIEDLPEQRPYFQRWVFLLYESPVHSSDFTNYNEFYNLSSTYKIDSDFPGFYEEGADIIWKENKEFNENLDFSSGKINFATAVISNCGGSSRRLEYIRELQKHVQVDVFGKCGMECPSHFKDKKPGDCKEILAKEYKFYLAFENSICNDYITEKFFQILRHNIIPVVLGGGNYSHFVPKSGYIDVMDFATPKKLAEYLKYLDKNKTAYNSYFKWKKHIVIDNKSYPFSPLCDMCIQLQLETHFGIKNQVIKDMNQLWGKKTNCKNMRIDITNEFSYL